MSGYSIQIEGMGDLLKALQDKPIEVLEEVGDEIESASREIVVLMKQRAPIDEGGLRGKISYQKIAQLESHIVAQSQNAAWTEFGTKSKAVIPAGLESVAAQFRGIGLSSSGDARKNIYEWCRRHGIEKKAWYLIYRSIVTNGIKPQPFFYPAINEVFPRMINNIKNIVTA